jgi:uncharacterized membrane protein SirB2
MMAYYPMIKAVHVAAVLFSGGFFLLRGLLVLFGHGHIARLAAVRYLSYCVDSVLLTVALMLFTMLPPASFANGWLLTKLVLLPVYIMLGVKALRADGSRPRQAVFYAAALMVFCLMISVARNHHPLGVFSGWFT